MNEGGGKVRRNVMRYSDTQHGFRSCRLAFFAF